MGRGLGNAAACGPIRGNVRPVTRSHAAPVVERDGPPRAVSNGPVTWVATLVLVVSFDADGLTRALYSEPPELKSGGNFEERSMRRVKACHNC